VVLVMSSGALRAYLLDAEALPSIPLTAMVPVNLRKEDTEEVLGQLPRVQQLALSAFNIGGR